MPSTPTAIGNGCGSEPACAHHPEARAVPADASAGTAVSYDSSASATIIAAPSAETACLAIRS